MTDDERRAAAISAARKIRDALTAAKDEAECKAICEKNDALFRRIQKVHPTSATIIINLVSWKRRDFKRQEQEQQEAFDL